MGDVRTRRDLLKILNSQQSGWAQGASAGTMATVSRVQVEELKKYVQPKSRELLYLVGIFRTLSLRDSIPVALRKLFQGGRGEKSGYIRLQEREQAV